MSVVNLKFAIQPLNSQHLLSNSLSYLLNYTLFSVVYLSTRIYFGTTSIESNTLNCCLGEHLLGKVHFDSHP